MEPGFLIPRKLDSSHTFFRVFAARMQSTTGSARFARRVSFAVTRIISSRFPFVRFLRFGVAGLGFLEDGLELEPTVPGDTEGSGYVFFRLPTFGWIQPNVVKIRSCALSPFCPLRLNPLQLHPLGGNLAHRLYPLPVRFDQRLDLVEFVVSPLTRTEARGAMFFVEDVGSCLSPERNTSCATVGDHFPGVGNMVMHSSSFFMRRVNSCK